MTYRRFAIVSLLLSLVTATAEAGFNTAVTPWQSVHQGDVVRVNRAAGSGPGGEYVVYSTVHDSRDPSKLVQGKSLFDSFCLEKNEHLDFGGNFIVGGLGREARNGGLGGQDSSRVADPIDPRTAYLYEQFFRQRLAGYQYADAVLRTASADQLQAALWFLENELPGKSLAGASLNHAYDPADMGIAAKTLGAGSQAYGWVFEADQAVRGGTHIGDRVRVVNLLNSQGGRAQDILTVATPEPSSLVVWGTLSAMGFYWAWRRRARSAKQHSR